MIESAIESAIAWVIESARAKENMNETNDVAGTTLLTTDILTDGLRVGLCVTKTNMKTADQRLLQSYRRVY